MFRKEDLKSKVSQFRLRDILLSPPSENDYSAISDAPIDKRLEYNEFVSIYVPRELCDWIGFISRYYDSEYRKVHGVRLTSSLVIKDATKLGAMILQDMEQIPEIGRIHDIVNWFNESVIRTIAFESDDTELNDYLNEFYDSYAEERESLGRLVWGKFRGKRKHFNIRPYPTWRDVLAKWEGILKVGQSDIYNIAMTLAISTEVKIRTLEFLLDWFYIVTRKICGCFATTTTKHRHVFIKHKGEILKRLNKKKTIDEEVKRIILEVLEGETYNP